MRVIVVDDEKAGIENLCYYLSKRDGVEILGVYQHPLEAIQNIITKRPDAVFMDIIMPEMNGMQIASEILKHNKELKIVFVTSYNDYAIKAFELNAIDYIVKPFSGERIEKAIERIEKLLTIKDDVQNKRKQEAIAFEAMKKEIIKIPVWKNDRIFLCDPIDISFLSADDGGVKICTCSGESYMCKDTLNHFDKKLMQRNFFRCHKSFIVNIVKIKEVIPWFNNTFMLKMEGLEDEVPVSRSYIKKFRKLFDL